MTRKEIIDGITQYLESLPANARIDVTIRNGMVQRAMNSGFMEARANGTRTIEIRINGGAQVTEGEPEYMESLRALMAEND